MLKKVGAGGSGQRAISALLVSLQHGAVKCGFAYLLHRDVQGYQRCPQRLQRHGLLLQTLAQRLVPRLQLCDLRAVCEEISCHGCSYLLSALDRNHRTPRALGTPGSSEWPGDAAGQVPAAGYRLMPAGSGEPMRLGRHGSCNRQAREGCPGRLPPGRPAACAGLLWIGSCCLPHLLAPWVVSSRDCRHRGRADGVATHVHLFGFGEPTSVMAAVDDVIRGESLGGVQLMRLQHPDRKSTRLNSSHVKI